MATVEINLRKATGEDFKYRDRTGKEQFKIGYPFFRKREDGSFSFDITKHTMINEFFDYLEKLKEELDQGKLYVVEPYDSLNSDK